MSKVTSSKIAPSKPESKNWRLMTFVGRAPASATQQVVNLTRSSFSSGTSPFRQQKYLGCQQRIRGAVNDRIGIEPLQRVSI